MRAVNPEEIAARVRAQMETYVDDYRAATRPAGLIGIALPVEQIERDLIAMRQALISPYWLEADVQSAPNGPTSIDRCVVVARHEEGYLLAYAPSLNEFTVLNEYQPGRFGSFGLDGDAVGAFISI